MESSKPIVLPQLVAHTLEGVRFYTLTENNDLLQGEVLESTSPETIMVAYSPSGQYLMVVNEQNALLFDTFKQERVNMLDSPPAGHVFECALISPNESYVLMFAKPAAKKGTASSIALLYDFQLKKIITKFEIEKLAREAVLDFKFRPNDDFLIWRKEVKQIEVFKLDELHIEPKALIETELPIDSFEISTNAAVDKFLILASHNQVTKNEGQTQIYQFPKFVKRSKFKVQHSAANQVIYHLAPDDHAVIIVLNKFVDQSGSSYYGAQRAMFVQIYHGKKKCYLPIINGQLGDISWNPNSSDFIIISGNQPATQILYNAQGDAKYQLGKSKKNTVLYSPLSNIVCLAGFGNLAGDMDLFQRGITGQEKVERGQLEIIKLGDTRSDCAVHCAWDASGRYLVTGVLTPRIRVENEFRIYKYDGTLLNRTKLFQTELYTIAWRPSKKGVFESFLPSPKSSSKPKVAVPQEAKKPVLNKMFASSKFAELLQKELGGATASAPHWLEGNEYDSHLPKEGEPKPKKEAAAPVQSWRTFGKLKVPEPTEENESGKKKKSGGKKKNKKE